MAYDPVRAVAVMAGGYDIDANGSVVQRREKPDVTTYVGKGTVERLKEVEEENRRLKKLVAEQALDLSILREATRGNY